MLIERTVGRQKIFTEVKKIGNDLLVVIYGGDEHHIGGVAIAYPTTSHYRDATTVSVNTITFPGHKDYIVATSAAETICKALSLPVVASVGIHYDAATPSDIKEIVKAVEDMVNELVLHYQNAE
ncbi:MAG: hypothetical protein ACFE7R_00915 [Candidatus Hodarchaeota archaeon]